MARVTVEDCIDKVDNRFDLVLLAAHRARMISSALVLRSGPGRPRSTSLLPPCHVAMLDRSALVESLAQLGRLAPERRRRPGERHHLHGRVLADDHDPQRRHRLARGAID